MIALAALAWGNTNHMRKAALFGGITQLLYGAFAVAPELFGVGRMPASNQFHNSLFSVYMFATSAILAIFFFAVYRNAASLNLSGAVRIASVIAAAALTIENLLPAYATIRHVVAAVDDGWGWKYHPFEHLAYVLVPAIPTLGPVSLIVFVFLVFFVSVKTPGWTPDRSGILRLTSFSVAVAWAVGLVWLLYSVIATPQLSAYSIFRLLLRLFTLVSVAGFFWVLGANQERGELDQGASMQ